MPILATNQLYGSTLYPQYTSSMRIKDSSYELSTGKVSEKRSLTTALGETKLTSSINFNNSLIPGVTTAKGILNKVKSNVESIKSQMNEMRRFITEANSDSQSIKAMDSAFQASLGQISNLINTTSYNGGSTLLNANGPLTSAAFGVSTVDATQAANVTAAKTALDTAANNKTDLTAVIDRVKLLRNQLTSTVADTIGARLNNLKTSVDATLTAAGVQTNVTNSLDQALKAIDDFTQFSSVVANAQTTDNINKLKQYFDAANTATQSLGNYLTSITPTAPAPALANSFNAVITILLSGAADTVNAAGGATGNYQGGVGVALAVNGVTGTLAGVPQAVTAAGNLGAQITGLFGATPLGGLDTALFTTKTAALAPLETAYTTALDNNQLGVASLQGIKRPNFNINSTTERAVDAGVIVPVRVSSSSQLNDSFALKIPSLNILIGNSQDPNGAKDDGLTGLTLSNSVAQNNAIDQKLSIMMKYLDNVFSFVTQQVNSLDNIQSGIINENGILTDTKNAYLADYAISGAELQENFIKSRVSSAVSQIGSALANDTVRLVQNIASAAA